jgi:2-(1,2-epoxy-1,2-dihydrophenyl)acetyl-CoA isomerase
VSGALGPVSVDVEGGVAVVTMRRPDRANALGPELMAALKDALVSLRRRDGVRAVVLAGEGRNFCAGGDLTHPLFDEPDAWVRLAQIEDAYGITEALLDLDVPAVAAIQGRCAGAGLALALGCDLRVMATSATFSLDFVRLGLVPDMGLCWLLAPAIGGARALELALTADVVGSGQALEWGLVNRVVPDGAEGQEARAWAEALVAFPPGGLAATRRLVRTVGSMDRDRGFALERETMNRLIPTPDSQAQLEAFRTRRRARA